MDRIDGAGFIDIGGGRRGFRDEAEGLQVQGTQVTAKWLTGVQEEIMRAVENSDLAGDHLSPMLPEALTRTVSGAVLYTDAGAANAHVLTIFGSYAPPTAYFDGMEICFRAAAENTGAATVNVHGLGIKSLKRSDGEALLPGDIATRLTSARYHAASGEFRLQPWSVSAVQQYFRASTATIQNIPYDTQTLITFQQQVNTLGAGWTGGHTLTAPLSGLYTIIARATLAAGTQETNTRTLFLVNGVEVWGRTGFSKGENDVTLDGVATLYLAAGDTLSFSGRFKNASGSGALQKTFGQLGIFLGR